MITTRYAIPVCILLALALIPTTIHSYVNSELSDGKFVQKIPKSLGGFTSTSTNRNPKYGMGYFLSTDWFERNYHIKNKSVRLFIARSYDHKRLYHHPELALSYAQSLPIKSIENLPNHPNISVHVLSDGKGLRAAYVLLYDNTSITNPIKHQLTDSLRLLVNSRKPITLFYTSQSNLLPSSEFKESEAAALLSLAIENFQSQAQL